MFCCGAPPPKSLFESAKPLYLTEEVFGKYDKDDSGSLDVKELKGLMADAFPEDDFSQEDLQAIMSTLDLDHGGTLGMNELRAFLRHYNPATQRMKVKTALIIIDVQNDFISGTLANPYNASTIVPVINGLRDKFDFVVISYDWHPYDHCSFTESHKEGKFPVKEKPEKFENFTPITLLADVDRPEHEQVMYPRHAVQNEWGSKCVDDLIVKDSDGKIYKGTKPNIDSYSAFFDNIKANDTGLTAMLEKEGVTDCFYCGLVTDICVKSTALHGAEAGFRSYVIEDASKPLSEDNMEGVRQTLLKAGVPMIKAEEATKMAAASKDVTIKEFSADIKKHAKAKAVHVDIEKTMSSHFSAKPMSSHFRAGGAAALAIGAMTSKK